MDIQINCRSELNRKVLKELAAAYAYQLKLNINTKSIIITTCKDVNDAFDADGFASEYEGQYYIFLQSTLAKEKMARILAHEMVHVKQFIKGQLKIRKHKKRYEYFWLGKMVKDRYLYRPWEIEAYSKESLLMHRAFELIRTKYGNQKSVKNRIK